MLRYKTETRPGLVALYDIRPGNGAGPFLQPRSPHGARSINARNREVSVKAKAVRLLAEKPVRNDDTAQCKYKDTE